MRTTAHAQRGGQAGTGRAVSRNEEAPSFLMATITEILWSGATGAVSGFSSLTRGKTERLFVFAKAISGKTSKKLRTLNSQGDGGRGVGQYIYVYIYLSIYI